MCCRILLLCCPCSYIKPHYKKMYRIFSPNHPSTSSDMLQSLPRFYSNQNEPKKKQSSHYMKRPIFLSRVIVSPQSSERIFIPNRDATCTTELHPNITISMQALDRCFYTTLLLLLLFFLSFVCSFILFSSLFSRLGFFLFVLFFAILLHCVLEKKRN